MSSKGHQTKQDNCTKVALKAAKGKNQSVIAEEQVFSFTTTMRCSLCACDVDRLMDTILEDTANWYNHAEAVLMCSGNSIEEQIACGGAVRFFLSDEKYYDLNINKLLNGFQLWFKNEPDYSVIYNGALDILSIGRNDADHILQYALFGKIKFK